VVFTFQSYPAVFRWPSTLHGHYDSVKLVDDLVGPSLTVDMLAQDSLLLALPSFDSFMIVASGPRGTTVGVIDKASVPAAYLLLQNYPNPFNPVTTVSFVISSASGGSFVTLKVYDVLGREVATLVNEVKEPGEYTVAWNASNASSGLYFCRMVAGEFVQTKKMVVGK